MIRILLLALLLLGCKQDKGVTEPEPPLIVALKPIAKPPPWNPIVVKVKVWFAEGADVIADPKYLPALLDTVSEAYENAADVTFAWDVRSIRPNVVKRYADYNDAYAHYSKYISKYRRDDSPSIALVPPERIKNGEERYQYGYATRTCAGVAVAALIPIYDETSHEFYRDVYGIAHELGHAMSAPHDDTGSCFVMDTGLLGCSLPAKFSEQSIAKIKKCAKKIGDRNG